MNIKELTNLVQNQKGGTKKDAKESIDAVFQAIEIALASGEAVKISGFGNFEPRTLKAGTARNPQTGEEVQVEERQTVGFKPSKVLRATVNAGV